MPPYRPFLHFRLVVLVCAWLGAVPAARAALPSGFQASTFASGLSQPTTLAFLPDGRLLIAEKTGLLRLVKNGALVGTPFLDAAELVSSPARFDDDAERGLIGVAVDPAFPTSPFVYLYYSVCKTPGSGASCSVAKNRVARVMAGLQGNPDRADPATQLVLLDDIDSDTGVHNGGWLGFGPVDGNLYVSVGDSGTGGVKAQDQGSLNGKVLRIAADGTVPLDNPYVGVFGARAEIWALGFRNPWRCRFHPGGRLYCGDVGQEEFEEIDLVVPGGNYGWPLTEGDFDPADFPPPFVRPVYAYPHPGSASITLGDFGSRTNFPAAYQQSLFFGDYTQLHIRRVVLTDDGATAVSDTVFETQSGGVTDLIAGPDGALYSADVIGGAVRRIAITGANRPPVAQAGADQTQGTVPLTVQFSSAGSSDADGDPLSFLWDFGDGSPPSSEPNPMHTYVAAGGYTATLRVSDGRTPIPGTDTATVSIVVGTPPQVTITAPVAESPYVGGQTIALAGSASDAEDGDLPASALHWEIRFHHAEHWHPFLNDLPGSPQEFTTATDNETAPDVSYRIILRATDSSGLTGEDSLYILPRLATLRLETSPPGLQIELDGQPRATPLEVVGVVGVNRLLGAPTPQAGQDFDAWSDGGARVHIISTPASDTTYTAIFDASSVTSTTTSQTATTATATSTTTTTEPPPTTSTTSAPVTSSTTMEPATTSSTTSAAPTTSTSVTAPVATSTSTSASSSTSTSIPSRCAPGLTPGNVACRLDELAGRITAASAELGRLAPGLRHRIAHAIDRVQRAEALCSSGRDARARAALRTAIRRLQTSLAKIRARAGRRLIPPAVAAEMDQLLSAAGAEVKALRDGLTCP